MILEGIVTTLNADDDLNIAPMGPTVDEAMSRFVLRPFATSCTYANLRVRGEGVFHVTDDVVMLARSAIGTIKAETQPAVAIHGRVIASACRAYEFRILDIDDRHERTRMHVEVVRTHRLRDFFGFNRAKHAVVEAAILATRTALLPREQILAEFDRLAILVEKTGGEQEHQAFTFLHDYVRRAGTSARAG